MRKITVLINGESKTITLQESILTNIGNPHLLVKKATIFWSFENITELNNKIVYDGTQSVLDTGYYNFNDLKKIFDDIESGLMTPLKVKGACTIKTSKKFELKEMATLLGFQKDEIFLPNTTTISPNKINVNHGLKYVKVNCNIVNSSLNFNENGRKCGTIICLPITSQQTLFGSVQSFNDIESRIAIDKGVINQLHFTVTDQDDKPIDIGNILLDVYIM